jgi:hypothetical protein
MNIILLFSNVTLYWRHWHHLTKSLICFARNGLLISSRALPSMRDCSQKSILDARLLSEIHSWYEIALRNPFLMQDCSQKSILDARLLSEIHSWCKIALRNPFLIRDCSQKSILDARLLSEIHSWYEIALRNPFLQNKSTTVYTVKPVLRGHHWIKEKEWPFKTGDLLKEVQFIWNYLRQEKKKVTF